MGLMKAATAGRRLLLLVVALLLVAPAASAAAQDTITNTAVARWIDQGTMVSAISNTVTFAIERQPAELQTLRYVPDGSGSIALSMPSCGQRSLTASGTPATIALNGSLLPSQILRIGEVLYVRVLSSAANRSVSSIDQIQIRATTTSGDDELFTVAETGVATGEFLAAITTRGNALGAEPSDCRLSVGDHDMITVEIVNADTDPGSLPVSSVQVLADPFGLVFDSTDGTPINGAIVTLVDDNTGAPATVYADDGLTLWPATVTTGEPVTDASGAVHMMPPGEYRFPLAPLGRYRLRIVPPAGFAAPSTVPIDALRAHRRPEGTAVDLSEASLGGVITLASPNPVRVDVPLDAATDPVSVSKTASRRTINPGDPAVFEVRVTNPNKKRALFRVAFHDTPSRWLRFIPTSVRIDGRPAHDRAVFAEDGRQMSIMLGRIEPEQTIRIGYAMIARPDAPSGEATNLAMITDERGQTSRAQASVRIEDEVLASRMTLIGRVTTGGCGTGEPKGGVAGVRVMLEDGSFAMTDAEGRYHFEGLVPGTHVVQVAEQTLPAGARFVDCARSTRSADSATSRFVTGQGGTLAVADFAVVLASRSLPAEEAVAVPRPLLPAAAADAGADGHKSAVHRSSDMDEAEFESRKAAGADIDWLAMGDGPTEFLFPGPDHNPRSPAVRVAIRHRRGERAELRIDGKPVDPVAFDGESVAAQGFAVSVWRGVPLNGETSVLSATVRSVDGSVTAQISRDVHFARTPARVSLVREKSRLLADGSKRPVLAIRVVDRNGRPVHAGITGEFTLNQPYESALAVDAMQARTLSGLDRSTPTYVVRGDDGMAYIELAPTMVSGPLRAEFVFKDDNIVRRQTVDTWIEPGDQPWTLVGLAEAATGEASIARQMGRDGRLDSDLGDHGRLAFYAKGRILGRYLLTASYDSAKQSDQHRLLGAIDPNAYYTVFGDGSSRRFDAASRERLYVRLEARAFYAIYGDFVTAFDQTILARYQRTVTGATVEGKSGVVHLQGFAARTGDTHRRDEIQGGGISGPYRLSQRLIVANSETVTIQVRDRLRSEVIIETKALQRFVDYDVDLLSGTITFRAPVLSRDAQLNPRFIIVDYEVEEPSGGEVNAGLRADINIAGGALRIGATAITDTGANDGARSDLAAMDVRANIGRGTELRAEAAVSRLRGSSEGAWLAQIEHHDENLDAVAYIRTAGRSFGLSQVNNAERGRRKVGMDGRYRLGSGFAVTASAWHDDSLTDAARREAAEISGTWRGRDIDLRLGIAMIDDRLVDGRSARSATIDSAATKRLVDNRLEISAATSIALGAAESVDLPSRYRLGSSFAVTPSVKLVGIYERATGEAVSANTLRAGFEVGPWNGARAVSTLGRQSVSEFGKRSFAAFGLTQSLQVTPSLAIDASLDSSTTLTGIDASRLISSFHPASSGGNLGDAGTVTEDFTALALGATWRKERWSLSARAEMRSGQLADRKGLVLGAIRQIGDGSMAGAGLSLTRAVDHDGQRSRVLEASVSIAHRPASSSVAILSKLELRSDEARSASGAGANLRTGLQAGGDAKSTRMMGSMSLNWSPRSGNGGGRRAAAVQRSELGLFTTVRHTFDTYEGFDLRGTSFIGGVDGRLGIAEAVEIGASVTARHALSSGVTSFAFGPHVGISFMKDTMLTVGYNLRGYRDPDFVATRRTDEGVFVAMRMKFDTGSLALLGVRP